MGSAKLILISLAEVVGSGPLDYIQTQAGDAAAQL